ncbi:MAG TPA: DsbA family protein [Pirellulales bacterium]|jgi:protein-disulfide isomerase|nr:DsbA family protein [Pirellulales bacterium]
MSTHSTARLVQSVHERDHVWGPATAAVTLLEYGDYECPYCGTAFGVVEELQAWAGENMRFVFRHFPLTQIHLFAEPAAEAAEAAGARGRFWEMHDALFTHQQSLDGTHLLRYAAHIGLDPAEIAEELHARQYADRIREDFLSGVHSGVNGTPTFFIAGVRYDGLPDFESLSAALEQAAETKLG